MQLFDEVETLRGDGKRVDAAGEGAAVSLHDFPRQRQPKAAAERLGRVERPEDPLDVPAGTPGPVSATSTVATPSVCAVEIVTVPPAGIGAP